MIGQFRIHFNFYFKRVSIWSLCWEYQFSFISVKVQLTSPTKISLLYSLSNRDRGELSNGLIWLPLWLEILKKFNHHLHLYKTKLLQFVLLKSPRNSFSSSDAILLFPWEDKTTPSSFSSCSTVSSSKLISNSSSFSSSSVSSALSSVKVEKRAMEKRIEHTTSILK